MIAYPSEEQFTYATDRVEFAAIAIGATLIILLLLKYWPLDD